MRAKNVDFEKLLSNWVQTMDDHEFENLLSRLTILRNWPIDIETDHYSSFDARCDTEIRSILKRMLQTPDGRALLIPWTSEGGEIHCLSFSDWLMAARDAGFRRELEHDSTKRIFAKKLRSLVQEGIFIETIEGYTMAPETRMMLRDIEESIDMGRDKMLELYLPEIAKFVVNVTGGDPDSLERRLRHVCGLNNNRRNIGK